jgi:hypothetical protein
MGEGIVDAEDALELADLAELATRLGGKGEVLDRAVEWRQGGRDLLAQAFDELDLDEVLTGIDGVLEGGVEVEIVEEALYELDDVVAAAVWAGQRTAVRKAALAVAKTIREVPEPFAPLAEYASQMARSPAIAADLDLYEYWLAVADAGQWKDPGP